MTSYKELKDDVLKNKEFAKVYYTKYLKDFLETFLKTESHFQKGDVKILPTSIYYTATNTVINIEKYDGNNYDIVVGDKKSHIRIGIDPDKCTYFEIKKMFDTTTNKHIYYLEFIVNNIAFTLRLDNIEKLIWRDENENQKQKSN